MPIERITADDLRDMEHQEGLVLQGCGGEAQEWLDGINDLLTQDGNIFHLMGIAARVLRQNGMAAEAKEMQTRIMGGACHSYEEALGIISEYVETELSPPRENRTKKKEKHEHER